MPVGFGLLICWTAAVGPLVRLCTISGALRHDERRISVTLEMHLRRQAEYIANLAGWGAVGIGSDLDGGFGREECPQEIDTEADLSRIAAVLPLEAREPVLGGNWLRFLRISLPSVSEEGL